MPNATPSVPAICLSSLLLPVLACAQTVWTPATSDAVPGILSAGLTPAGFRLEMAAPPGEYELQRSTTLLANSWLNQGAIMPAGGVGEITDPGALGLPTAFYRVAGGFQETRMKLVSLNTTLVSSSLDDWNPPFEWGGMWTRQTRENLLFQTAQPSNGLIKLLDGESGEFLVEPDIVPRIVTWVSKWNDPETLPITISGDGWNVDVGDGLDLFSVESGGHSFMGIFREDDWTFSDGDITSTERSLESLWLIAKSENAQPADLAGDWGFVRFLSDGFEFDGVLDGMVFTSSITAGPNPRTISVDAISGFEILHEWSTIPAGVLSFFYDEEPGIEVALELATDGAVTLTVPGVPGESEGERYRGMVSPTAGLMVASSSIPNIEDNPGNEPLDFGEVRWVVGVKRDNAPALAGKTYRIIRHGWWVEGDFFEIDRNGADDRLEFSANGNSVTRSSQFNYDSVSFVGGLGSGSDDITLEMNVSVDGQGRILMEFEAPGEFTAKTFGFKQMDGRLLVLVDCIDIPENLELGEPPAAGIGLIIALEEP